MFLGNLAIINLYKKKGCERLNSLQKLKKFEGMNILVDTGGILDIPAFEVNNCSVQEFNNKILLQDEDDDINPVTFKRNDIEYIEELKTDEAIIHLINNLDIRIMFN